MSLSPDHAFHITHGYRLQWEEAQNMFVLLYPEGLIELNQSSAEILQVCDGTKKLADIIHVLETKFETTGLESDIVNFLTIALDNGWLTQRA